jgi:hypothetical protein
MVLWQRTFSPFTRRVPRSEDHRHQYAPKKNKKIERRICSGVASEKIMLLLICTCAAVASSVPSLPPHPRLRISDGDLRRVKHITSSDDQGGDPLARELLANITAHADLVLAQPIPPSATALLCDPIRDHMYTFGLLFSLSGNKTRRAQLKERAVSELLAVSQLKSWNPKRFLTVAETMHAVAIGYDLFYHELTSAQRAAIEQALFTLGIQEGISCHEKQCEWNPLGPQPRAECQECWWTKAPMNWNLVSNGGLAIAALALMDVPAYANASAQALAFAIDQGYPAAVAAYGPANDGGWPEGPHYMVYATKNLVAALESLIASYGNTSARALSILRAPGLNVSALYALQTHITPSGLVFNYGDSTESGSSLDIPAVAAAEAGYGENGMRLSSVLLALSALYPSLGPAPALLARRVLHTSNASSVSTSFDEAVVCLLRWRTGGTASDLLSLDRAAHYTGVEEGGGYGKAVGVLRSSWQLPPSSHLERQQHAAAAAAAAAAGGRTSNGTAKVAPQYYRSSNQYYLGFKGGDTLATHMDLDCGTFVWETGVDETGVNAYRWAVDLGAESYHLPGIFGTGTQNGSRYGYYRKATQGANTLTFYPSSTDVSGAVPVGPASVSSVPSVSSVSDQLVNASSPIVHWWTPSHSTAAQPPAPLSPYHRDGTPHLQLPRHSLNLTGGALVRHALMRHALVLNASVELTHAYTRQLGGARVLRTFVVEELSAVVVGSDSVTGSRLTVIDDIAHTNDSVATNSAEVHQDLSVTWSMHTRASIVVTNRTNSDIGSHQVGLPVALLKAPDGRKLRVEIASVVPTGPVQCGEWVVIDVQLPTSDPPRFPIRGARKLSITCQPNTTRIEVMLSDL